MALYPVYLQESYIILIPILNIFKTGPLSSVSAKIAFDPVKLHEWPLILYICMNGPCFFISTLVLDKPYLHERPFLLDIFMTGPRSTLSSGMVLDPL